MRVLEQLEGRMLFASYSAATAAQLISAINAANNSAGADTITLAAGATFSLTAVSDTTNWETALPRITDPAGLTIAGNGAALESTAGRFFNVAGSAALTLQNLTLRGASAGGASLQNGAYVAHVAQGGAIYNAGSLTVDGVTFSGNGAYGNSGTWGWFVVLPDATDAMGGAIYSTGGALTITNCAFLDNGAAGGRGADATPPADPGNFPPTNPATPSANGYGGAVYINGGSAVISGSVFTRNYASGPGPSNGAGSAPGSAYGGGIYAAGAVTMRNCSVTLNQALSGGYLNRHGKSVGVGIGGGIYRGGGNLSLDDYTIAHILDNIATTSSPNIAGSYKRLR